MEQVTGLGERMARKYGVWIIVGLMALEIALQWRRNEQANA